MGLISTLVNKYKKAGHSYITEPSIKHYMKKLKSTPVRDFRVPDEPVGVVQVQVPMVDIDMLENNNNGSQMSSISPDDSNRNKGGRPLGTSEELKAAIIKAKELATTECAVLYKEMQEQAKADGLKTSKRGTLSNLIKETEDKHGLLHGTIKAETITKRVYRNNLTGFKYQCTSPVAQMEPVLVDYCIKLCKIGKALDKKQVLLLANSLIKTRGWEEPVIEWKVAQGMYDASKPLLGTKWYYSYLNRYRHKLKRGRCKIQDVNRKSWCTYDHFEAMYADVYETMCKAGIVSKLDFEVSLNIKGDIVDDNSNEKFGRKTKYIMEHPEWCLFADETGCNTNQKEDGYRGGQLFVLENGCDEGGLTGVTTDIHFTVMCFTCGTGEPVLCVVILKSEQDVKDIPLSWKWGIDITKNANNVGQCQADLFEDNCGTDKVVSGGPKCTFRGKEIPCFVGASKKASITSQMLADILAYIDEMNIYDRSTGKMPFLLVDGHHSRIGLPFLDYIFDDNHRWMVSIGVPYGTHIWQVADSTEQNAIFKKLLSEEKAIYLEYRPVYKQKFAPTDIIPLVKKCWDKSFGHCFNSSKAIAARGWNPLTYTLLDNKRLVQPIEKQQTTNNPPLSSVDGVDPLSLNTSVGMAGTYTDIIVEHVRQDTARMEGSRKKRLAKAANYTGVEEISKVFAMRSGQMATTGNFTFQLGHRDTAKRKLEEIDLKNKEKKQRFEKTKLKHTSAFNDAFGKCVRNEELSSDNYRALIKNYYARGKDSPLQKTKTALRDQWQRRKIKYNVQNSYLYNNENDPNNNLPPVSTCTSNEVIISHLEGPTSIENPSSQSAVLPDTIIDDVIFASLFDENKENDENFNFTAEFSAENQVSI